MQRPDPAPPSSRRAIIFTPDPTLASELGPLILPRLTGTTLSHVEYYPEPREAAAQLGPAASPLIFLDVTSSPEQALAILQELTRQRGVHVLALLGGNNPDAIMKCLRAGAADFLMRPFTADQVEAALGKLARVQPAAEAAAPTETTKVIVVMPAKGACGATTVACNLAFQFRRMGAKRVLLADLDPLAGTVSFLLKLKSSFSYMDVLQRGHELDPDLWKATITNSGGVDVLLSPDMALTGMPQQVDASPILNFARQSYDVVVVDTGSVYGEWNLSQARLATELVLVTTNELPALQAAQRALTYLETNKIGKWKTRLVVNRYQRDFGLSREVIGTALHTEVFDTIPSDYEAIQKALMDGKPALPSTAFGRGMMQLAERLGAPKTNMAHAPSNGGLSKLLGGLFSKSKKPA
jgi:pilus assembly protein CpaE